MMNQPDGIINGKSIANLRGKITRHIMMFQPGTAELGAAVAGVCAHCRQSGYCKQQDTPKAFGGTGERTQLAHA